MRTNDTSEKTNNILSFNISSETWNQVGHMRWPRMYHSASVVNADDILKYCKHRIPLLNTHIDEV